MYTYISKSLCCTPEINTILSINYTSIRQIKRKKEKILYVLILNKPPFAFWTYPVKGSLKF